jgi:hypothetical protein
MNWLLVIATRVLLPLVMLVIKSNLGKIADFTNHSFTQKSYIIQIKNDWNKFYTKINIFFRLTYAIQAIFFLTKNTKGIFMRWKVSSKMTIPIEFDTSTSEVAIIFICLSRQTHIHVNEWLVKSAILPRLDLKKMPSAWFLMIIHIYVRISNVRRYTFLICVTQLVIAFHCLLLHQYMFHQRNIELQILIKSLWLMTILEIMQWF